MTWEAGNLDAGEQYVRENIERSRAVGSWSTLAHGLYALGRFAVVRRQFPEAHACFEEGMRIAQSIGEEWLIPIFLIEQGDLDYRTQDLGRAQQNLDQAIQIAQTTGYNGVLSLALIHAAEVQLALGEVENAQTALRDGLKIASDNKNVPDMLLALLVAVKLWRWLGKMTQAVEWIGMLLHSAGADPGLIADTQMLCVELRSALDDEPFVAALESGRTLHLNHVVAEVLGELSTS
jgi:tetratricopeptide (TPR) repeat protein